jgi:hypothetical protein
MERTVGTAPATTITEAWTKNAVAAMTAIADVTKAKNAVANKNVIAERNKI